MAKTISFTLDANSIQNAVNEMKAYQRDFQEKCQRFRELIAERVAWSASRGFSTAIADDTFAQVGGRGKTRWSNPLQPKIGSDISVTVEHSGNLSIVFASGKDAVFIEYGAGVYHNGNAGGSPHPWGPQQGYFIGAYGYHKGTRKVWGFRDANGTPTLTHGTPAAMPMYKGLQEAIRAIDEIAREVFG